MVDKHDPLAPYIPKGETAESVEAERQRLLRQQMEDEFAMKTGRVLEKDKPED